MAVFCGAKRGLYRYERSPSTNEYSAPAVQFRAEYSFRCHCNEWGKNIDEDGAEG